VSDAPAIQCANLDKWIDDRPIVRGIDLCVAPGQFVALLGANGAGKTTLLKIFAMLTAPSKGELRLFGQTPQHGKAALRGRIGMLGHQPMLYRDLSAWENLKFFARLYAIPQPAQRASQLLEIMGLTARAGDPVRNFSRGMTQRLSIARALLHDPPLLLADEPFAGLDLASTRVVEALFLQLHSAGKTIVMVNHDVAQSLRLAQRMVVLRNGSVALDQVAASLDAAAVAAILTGGEAP
jgi:ABC-type multidrug transport system ATPase subunit